MKCSLNLFLNFIEADTQERRERVVKQYKKGATGAVKGMNSYYVPALQAMRGTLCPGGTPTEKLQAVRRACFNPRSTDKLNDARIESNARVVRAFLAEFGNKQLSVRPNVRMQFHPIKDVLVNIQSDFYGEVDEVEMLWKIGLCVDPRPARSVRALLQAVASASCGKGLEIPIHNIRYLDSVTGNAFAETAVDAEITADLQQAAWALASIWDKVA